jgi:hypothetical protein
MPPYWTIMNHILLFIIQIQNMLDRQFLCKKWHILPNYIIHKTNQLNIYFIFP